MAEVSVFIGDEGCEPGQIDDELLREDLRTMLDCDELTPGYTLGELIRDHTGYSVEPASMVSEWSLRAAVWALKQIEQGADDARLVAKRMLNEIAAGGDLADRTTLVDDSEALWGFEPIVRIDAENHGPAWPARYEWADDLAAASTEERSNG